MYYNYYNYYYIISYLGTESSPRSDFSGLQRTLMTELRP